MQPNDPNRMQGGSGNAWNAPNTLSGGVVTASATTAPREGFLTASFVWMFVGLLISAGAAWFTMSNTSALQAVMNAWIVLLIAEIALVFILSLAIAKLPPLVALAMFFVYALLNGLTLGVIVLLYTNPTIAADGSIVAGDASGVVSAFLGASAIFAGAALYGAVTKRDLASLGGILFMGLIGLVVMSFVQLFLFRDSEIFNLVIGAVGVLIFTGLTAYDVQRIQRGALPGINRDSASVMGALALYLDFINLFLMLLRLFGNNR
ncbi:MAG: Bax inhibitor-1 family protein [Chloroflexota bacterium]